MTPQRIQRQRVKGWRMPPGAIYVGRPTAWGNPYKIGEPVTFLNPLYPAIHEAIVPWLPRQTAITIYGPHAATAAYRKWITQPEQTQLIAAIRTELAGHDLACWCAPPVAGEDEHCHADVLLRIAAGGAA
jgi:hypothetical protein